MDFKTLLDMIMETSTNVRFCAVCNMNGKIEWNSRRDGVTHLLSPEESEKLLLQAVNSWKSRNELSDKLGKGQYVLAAYENLRRLTMPLGNDHLLLVTFDTKGGQFDVIESVQNILSGDYTLPR